MDPAGRARRPLVRRPPLALAGLTAVLCALAALAGLYLSGHLIHQTGGGTGNTVQHISSSASTPAPSPRQPHVHPTRVP